ncbi:MAG: DUF6110 family protein [Bacteroidales bacterium]|nr:DUF6110 family protein [Lachnoclostridium sp.]MCM1385449.1 DUF6110 family protein [Lachnoclostridium sp.]MCM1466354.1 DUF6110 family protein [Bacteroidales bacterium]
MIDFEKVGIFAAGMWFGTAGIKLLSSKEAKKVYAYWTAEALRAKDYIKENAEEVYEEARQINRKRFGAKASGTGFTGK